MVVFRRRFYLWPGVNNGGADPTTHEATSWRNIPVDALFPYDRLVEMEYHPVNYPNHPIYNGTLKHYPSTLQEGPDVTADFFSWYCLFCRRRNNRFTAYHCQRLASSYVSRCCSDQDEDPPYRCHGVVTSREGQLDEEGHRISKVSRFFVRPCHECKRNHRYNMDRLVYDAQGELISHRCYNDKLDDGASPGIKGARSQETELGFCKEEVQLASKINS